MKPSNDNSRAPKREITPQVAGGIGWFSIALGVTEIVAAEQITRFLGLPKPAAWVVRAFGAREIVSGLGLIQAAPRRRAGWLWMRLVGDLLDLLALTAAFAPTNKKRKNAIGAAAFVLSAAAGDAVTGAKLTMDGRKRVKAALAARV